MLYAGIETQIERMHAMHSPSQVTHWQTLKIAYIDYDRTITVCYRCLFRALPPRFG